VSTHTFKRRGSVPMVNISNSASESASKISSRQFRWDALVLLIATFWLSSSVLLDFFMMPMMYESGMMNEPGFATGSYSLFWVFNRVEVLCAAAILTGLLVLRERRSQFEVVTSGSRSRWALLTSGALLAIAFTYTYFFTPQLSALGLNLSGGFSEPAPPEMSVLHLAYWGLETVKLLGAAFLIRLCYRDIASAFQ
ncbi:MAG: hypothetical protein AAGJ69_06840, partial [Cyanobacteria bacterium J06559_1]